MHKLKEGMSLVFYYHKTFFAHSTIVAKRDNATLTEHQWRTLHFKPGFVVRALRVLDEDQSAALDALRTSRA